MLYLNVIINKFFRFNLLIFIINLRKIKKKKIIININYISLNIIIIILKYFIF